MESKKPEVTFKLARFEDLTDSEKSKVEGLNGKELNSGLIIKEYKSGSFVRLRRFIPKNNLLTSQIAEELNESDREKITNHIQNSLIL